MNRQRGLSSVEFALVAGLFMILLFGVLEFGRLMYVWNTLAEATRRGARLATVMCPNPAGLAQVKDVTLFNAPGAGGDSTMLRGLRRGNVCVEYTQCEGTPPMPTKVSVSIINYQIDVAVPIPGFDRIYRAPTFKTTLPRESLGMETGCTPTCLSACP